MEVPSQDRHYEPASIQHRRALYLLVWILVSQATHIRWAYNVEMHEIVHYIREFDYIQHARFWCRGLLFFCAAERAIHFMEALELLRVHGICMLLARKLARLHLSHIRLDGLPRDIPHVD